MPLPRVFFLAASASFLCHLSGQVLVLLTSHSAGGAGRGDCTALVADALSVGYALIALAIAGTRGAVAVLAAADREGSADGNASGPTAVSDQTVRRGGPDGWSQVQPRHTVPAAASGH